MEYCPAPKIIAVNKSLLNIYYVPGHLATGHLAVNKNKVLSFLERELIIRRSLKAVIFLCSIDVTCSDREPYLLTWGMALL